jgi:fructosamine-3-kinase
MIAGLADAVGARGVDLAPVGGGDINDAYRARLADGRTLFVKTHADPPDGMFAAEADGLRWLASPTARSFDIAPAARVTGRPADASARVAVDDRPAEHASAADATGPLRVPRVIAVDEHFLALEWLELGGRPDDARFGRQLAALHRLGAPSFGYARDNYVATIPQPHVAVDDLPAFWIDHRVRPVAERARAAGRMPDVRARLDAVRAKADRFGPPEPPARLHGDLWWGNVGAIRGEPVVFDPAVYGGHREIDLAMLALFGSVSNALAGAYHEVWPLADGWRERVRLWQLYPLAVHAALFGGGYGAQVVRILDDLA